MRSCNRLVDFRSRRLIATYLAHMRGRYKKFNPTRRRGTSVLPDTGGRATPSTLFPLARDSPMPGSPLEIRRWVSRRNDDPAPRPGTSLGGLLYVRDRYVYPRIIQDHYSPPYAHHPAFPLASPHALPPTSKKLNPPRIPRTHHNGLLLPPTPAYLALQTPLHRRTPLPPSPKEANSDTPTR